jgi:hypothetical protein
MRLDQAARYQPYWMTRGLSGSIGGGFRSCFCMKS